MSPRRKGSRTLGCYIEWTPGGAGRLCFRWPRGKDGKLHRITTDYTEADRAELERVRDLIGAEIRNGIFDPARRFPSVFSPKVSIPKLATKTRSLAADVKAWIAEKELRPAIRRSRIRDYRSHLENYIEPSEIAHLDPAAIGRTELEGFQLWILTKAGRNGTGVSEKTAANVIRATLRAYLRDRGFAFGVLDMLRWEHTAPTREQDPFEASERDKILNWFRRKRPFEEYVSLELRFIGISPSEARGLNVGDFSRVTGTVKIQRSRHLGGTAATKTLARKRVALLGTKLAADVATICGVRDVAEPFISVAEDTLRDNFAKAQIALGIRHRSLYQAKHTYATLALLDGDSPAVVARNLGISLATLGQHYAAALQQGRVGIPVAKENTGERKKGRAAAASH